MRLFLAAGAAGLALAGCTSAAVTGQQPAAPPASSAQPATPQPASTPAAGSTRYPASWVLPDRKLSPGAVQPGYAMKDICPHVNKALEAMRPTTAEKARVYAAYGITSHPAGKYEIDHVIPVELLGLVDMPAVWATENLYPEPNDTADPAMIAKYHLDAAFVHNSKDILEDRLHQLVCSGQLPLSTAQQAIATDWRAAYAQYVGKPPAGSSPSRTYMSSPAPQPTRTREVSSPVPVRTRTYAPPATHSAAPVHAACYPKTDAGNCYEPGEFCRKADLGMSGIAGDGARITCVADGSRSRWE